MNSSGQKRKNLTIINKNDIESSVSKKSKVDASYKIPSLKKFTLNFIERCFDQIVGTNEFLQLEYSLVKEILSSGNLNVKSELQVVNAINSWVEYKLHSRGKFASELLTKSRLSLLSSESLKMIQGKGYVFSRCPGCEDLIKDYSKEDEMRCNTSNDFDIMFFGVSSSVLSSRYYNKPRAQRVTFDYTLPKNLDKKSAKEKATFEHNLPKIFDVATMKKALHDGIALELEGDVYLLGGKDQHRNHNYTIDKYTPANNAWKKVTTLPNYRRKFCACSFMGSIYLFGGTTLTIEQDKACTSFNPVKGKWDEHADMKSNRVFSACCIFQGKIVVSGGLDKSTVKRKGKEFLNFPNNLVEQFDVCTKTWTDFPCTMVHPRFRHGSVSLKNKLYMIGGDRKDMEVYDSISKKFTLITTSKIYRDQFYLNKVMAIKNEIYLFQEEVPVKYNPEKCSPREEEEEDEEKWSSFAKHFNLANHFLNFCCVKIPKHK